MTRGRVLLFGAALLCSCAAQATGIGEPKRSAKSVESAAEPPFASEEMLDDLAQYATGAPRDPSRPAPIVRGQADLERYVEELLEDPRFAEVLAPQVLLHGKIAGAGAMEVPRSLVSATSGNTRVYYLDNLYRTTKPCAEKDAVPVSPWWAPKTTIHVCSTSYRPTVRRHPTGDFCGGSQSALTDSCGCGPNLIYCARSEAHVEEIRESLRSEITRTIARIVAEDRPITEIFSANETVRDRNAEMVYRRWRITTGEPAAILEDLAAWPAKPVLAPRHEVVPRQHAGVLTTPGFYSLDTGGRAVQKFMYDVLWCSEPASTKVAAAAVFAIGTADLRLQSGWQKLAAMPICTDCHARLDYGYQFFRGYTAWHVFDPAQVARGTGKLFVRNIDDPRGEAPLDPQSFVKLATAQPEFAACAMKTVGSTLVDGGWYVDQTALREAFTRKGTFKAMMRVALLGYAAHERAAKPGSVDPAPSAPPDEGALRSLVDAHCVSCHGGSKEPDLRKPWGREVAREMLGEVAGQRMPKGAEMPWDKRQAMIDGLIGKLWSDPEARAMASNYYRRVRPLPVHRVHAALAAVDLRAGKPNHARDTSFLKGGPNPEHYSPSIAAAVALEALRACKAAGHTKGKELEACVEKAVAVEGTVNIAVPR